jgi:hypothetical protein
MSSGSEVAKETMVMPTTTLGTCQRAAAATAALRRKSAPSSNRTKPTIRKMASIYFFYEYTVCLVSVPLRNAKDFI